jgi:RimJ/RimL family protein N-acetyltransferase
MTETGVTLRRVREDDVPDWVRWLNDAEVTEFTLMEVGLVTMEGEQRWYEAVTAPGYKDYNWQIEVKGKHIGGCSLTIGDDGRQAEFGIIIGDKTAWNRGYGTAATKEVLRVAFAEMKLHRVFLCTHGDNARAIRCYEKCGFRHEGRWIQARRKRGEWRDTVWMAVLRKEWEERANRCCSL